jgi:tripartite-type tricarboxylate transporter receptor subunit TctC
MKKLLMAASVGAMSVFGVSVTAAQTYPSSTIQLMVPFSPGTGPDIIARTLGEKMSERLKQPVVVINRTGAGGVIGATQIARAAPDGYNILVAANGLMIAAHLNKISYQPVDDFAPISLAATGKLLLVANPKTNINSVADLISRAKEQPGKLNYASSGIGTPHHMAMELFKHVTGSDLTHVPYKGVAGALSDVIAGHADVMFVPIHVAMPQVEANNLKALAVGSATRSQTAPNIPTLIELGHKVDVDVWIAYMAPAGTPANVIETLRAEIHRLLADPEIRTVLERQGLQASSSSPEQLRTLMRQDYKIWGEVIEKNKIVGQ